MHWFAAFTSSPSSSASPSSSTSSTSTSASKGFSPDRAMKIICRRFRPQKRRLPRTPPKVDHPNDEDANSGAIVVFSGQDHPSLGTSHPLPLPELGSLIGHDDRHKRKQRKPIALALPSPKDWTAGAGRNKGPSRCITLEEQEDPYREKVGSAGSKSSSVCSDTRKHKEHDDTQRYMRAPGELNTVEGSPDIYDSAPTSPSAGPTPFSSPALSPARIVGDMAQYHHHHHHHQLVWSAPEMSPSDPDLASVYSYQMFSEIQTCSGYSSPILSPRASPYQSPSRPMMSPLHDRLSSPSTSSRWSDSTAQTIVHPLPRPPGAISPSPSHSSSIHQVPAKPELTKNKSQWKKGKLIGRGTFGSVYVASNRETGALCAMKEVELLFDDEKSAECIKQLQQEIKVLSQLKHPNIVQYYGSEIVGDKFYIYLEYVHPGALNKYIREHCGAMTESVIRNFTRHILSGLAYLHSTKTIHRDIKCANLLVDAYGVVKLADFGMAKHLSGQAAELSLKGSPYWLAPELLECEMQKDASSDQALAVDIWSLGCTIIEMMNGKPPWSELEGPAAMFKIMKETPPIPETLSPEGQDFLRLCLLRNPAERPTASMLLEHRFLKNSQHGDVTSCSQALGRVQLTRIS